MLSCNIRKLGNTSSNSHNFQFTSDFVIERFGLGAQNYGSAAVGQERRLESAVPTLSFPHYRTALAGRQDMLFPRFRLGVALQLLPHGSIFGDTGGVVRKFAFKLPEHR